MAIVPRNGKHQVKVRKPGSGGWWTCTCPTLKDAREVEREMESAKSRGQEWVHPRDRQVGEAAPLTLRTIGEAFIRDRLSTLAPRTQYRYAGEVERFVSWAEAQKLPAVSDLSRPLLRSYIASLMSRNVTSGTVAKNLKTLHQLWRWADDNAEDHGWTVPRARTVELPRVLPTLTVAPTWAEMDDMLEVLAKRVPWAWRAAVLQRFTGMRIGETVTLTWDKIRWVADRPLELTITPELSKGGYSGRVVPISRHLAPHLVAWRGEPAQLICGEGAAKVVDTSRPARVFSTAWSMARVRALAWKQPTHALRKGVYSGLLALGANRDAVDILVGHELEHVRDAYIDQRIALDVAAVVALIPAIGSER